MITGRVSIAFIGSAGRKKCCQGEMQQRQGGQGLAGTGVATSAGVASSSSSNQWRIFFVCFVEQQSEWKRFTGPSCLLNPHGHASESGAGIDPDKPLELEVSEKESWVSSLTRMM